MKITMTMLALAVTACLPVTAGAAPYPERPVTLVVPYAAGGGADTAARIIAKRLARLLSQPVIVENKAGGATQIGTSYVVRAKPDGYTLLMGTANLATNPAFYKNLPYQAQRDLQPIVLATDVPVYLFASPDSDIKQVPDIIKLGKLKTGLSYATAGVGSIPHMAAEMLAREAALRLQHVPYKGSSEAVIAAASNQVPLSFDNLAPALAQVRAGRLVPLAIAAARRSPALPGVPTLQELHIPVTASSWWGILAPAGTPDTVVEQLNKRVNAVLADPEVRKYLLEQGIHTVGGTSGAFAQHIRAETAKWQEIVRDARIQIDN